MRLRPLASAPPKQGGLKTARYQILKNMSGVLHPGTTTLLLGPPGSGKSVFLQTLSGRLQSSASVHISGSVKYNGREASEFELRRTAAYVDQSEPSRPEHRPTSFA
jgi:ABC-type multidrug transport system ATPase subunit